MVPGGLRPHARRAGLNGRAAGWAAETLPYDPSSQFTAWLATAPVSLHGTLIPAGSRVILLVASASRDTDVFADPDRYHPGRPDAARAVSFGAAPHFCLGAPLASLEVRIALEELAAVITDYEVDTSSARCSRWPNTRGFTTLPTQVTRRPGRPARA